MWSPASYAFGTTRGNAGVEGIAILVVDVDHKTPDQAHTTLARLDGLSYFVHSSHSDSVEDRCFRVLVEISRPVLAPEWSKLWRQVARMLGGDEATKDAARAFYLPSRPSDAVHDATDGSGFMRYARAGAPLDVDAILAHAPPEPTRVAAAPPPTFVGAPSIEALGDAARALAAAWPRPRETGGKGGRYRAGLTLCGALAHEGWPPELVGEFVSVVADLAYGDPEPRVWANAAHASCSKVSAGEAVTGWPTLLEILAEYRPDVQGEPAVGEARLALGFVAPTTIAADMAGLVVPPPDLGPNAQVEGTWEATFAKAFQDVQAAVGSDEKSATTADKWRKPAFKRAGELRSDHLVQWLVKGLITLGGIGVTATEPKSAKTWLATEIAMAVATGTPAFGIFECAKHPVAYFYAEDSETSVKTRLAALAAGRGMTYEQATANMLISPRGDQIDMRSDADVAWLLASARWFGGVGLLVLDPLRDVHTGEEDKADSMAPVMARFRTLYRLLDAHIHFIHHSAKASDSNKGRRQGQKMRGSSVIHGAIDCGIYLSGLKGDGKTEFTNTVTSEVKGAQQAGTFVLTLKIEDDPITLTAVKATWQRSTVEESSGESDLAAERVIDVVRAVAGSVSPMSKDMIRKRTNGRMEIIVKAIKIAEQDGLIENQRRGAQSVGWVITPKGLDVFRGAAAPETPAGPGPDPASAALLAHLGAGPERGR